MFLGAYQSYTMVDYTIAILPESSLSITNGVVLDGITQGDGSHLLGEFITINNSSFTTINITDDDTNLDDNDGNQVLNGAQAFDGTSYSNNIVIEAEYQFTLRDNATGDTYQVVSMNFATTSPSYGTVEGLAFVGTMPPVGVSLEVISAREGPGSLGQAPIDISSFITCFCEETRIEVENGYKLISDIKIGDKILTQQHGFQEVNWIGSRRISQEELQGNKKLLPIKISANSLGPNIPDKDLLVSRQHRVIIDSKISQKI